MSEHREFLARTLRRVLDGGDIANGELSTAIKDARVLQGAEMKAYFGLSYWADDADVRAKDPTYASMRRQGLARLFEDLGDA